MKELKGIAATQGIIKGVVRIILDPSKISKMEEGEILVTQTTNPLFTPAIIKAKALITDVGGVLSHAAIIARELNIPCIVGTQSATRILKDGQEIIVNCKEGLVYYE